jgi:hypothetical protein
MLQKSYVIASINHMPMKHNTNGNATYHFREGQWKEEKQVWDIQHIHSKHRCVQSIVKRVVTMSLLRQDMYTQSKRPPHHAHHDDHSCHKPRVMCAVVCLDLQILVLVVSDMCATSHLVFVAHTDDHDGSLNKHHNHYPIARMEEHQNT